MGARNAPFNQGFYRSNFHRFIIPSGEDGSAVAPIDLGRNYAFIAIKCRNTSGIAPATTMTGEAGESDGDDLATIFSVDGITQWVTGVLPDAVNGTFRFVLDSAFGAQRLRFILSNVTTLDVTIEVIGYDAGVKR